MSNKNPTEKEILVQLDKDINKLSLLYNKKYINYSGTTAKKYYYDIISKYLLEHISLFNQNNIQEIKRNKPYPKNHKPLTEKEKTERYKEKRGEEWFARSLLECDFNHIGKIKEYQLPIKDERNQKAGKIDLIAIKEKELLSIIELKREYNTETLLRAILEINTYFFQVDKNRLCNHFSCSKIQQVVLIFKDSLQHQQYKQSKLIRELAEKLQVKILVLDYKVVLP